MNTKLYCFSAAIGMALFSTNALALNVVLSNDDGLTSNVKALYSALKAQGHDVVVSIPCSGQSGMGAAIKFFNPIIPLTEACLNNAGQVGEPGAGSVSKDDDGFDYQDFYYVNGTPIMALAYGLDVVAAKRWGGAPDLVLSGPNEGQNVGSIVNSSGTVSNAQFAAARGLPAIALSADSNTEGEEDEAGNHADNPLSAEVATLTTQLLNALMEKTSNGAILPTGVALNVNFPTDLTNATWAFSRHGSYNQYSIKFVEDLSQDPVAQGYGLGQYAFPGISIGFATAEPTDEQAQDESVVYRSQIAVTAMQVGFEQSAAGQQWLRLRLRDLLSQ